MELLVYIQQGSSQLPHLTLFPVPLHCFMLILFLFFSAGKELREDNKDYQQVLLDVRRSLRRFPPGEGGFCSSALPTLQGQEQGHGAPPGSDLPGKLQKVTLHYSKGLTSRKHFPCELTAAASCSEALLQPSVSFSCLCTDGF